MDLVEQIASMSLKPERVFYLVTIDLFCFKELFGLLFL